MTAAASEQAASVHAALMHSTGYRELGYQAATVAGKRGWKWSFQISGDQRVDYFLNDCGTGIAVLGSASPSAFPRHQDLFADVANSVKANCARSAPTPSPTPAPKPSPPSAYSQTCGIKAWYSNYASASYGYIHFKCVDEASGLTAAEALGSDSFNFKAEAQAARRTAKRVELVDQLATKLESDGWRQIGAVDGGEWYQLRFGR